MLVTWLLVGLFATSLLMYTVVAAKNLAVPTDLQRAEDLEQLRAIQLRRAATSVTPTAQPTLDSQLDVRGG